MNERRGAKRTHLMFHITVLDCDTDENLGYLVDLTTEGLLLISEEPPELNKVFKLCLHLPVDVFGMSELNLVAESRWCKKDLNPEFYDTGFRMIEVAQEQVEKINCMIEEYGFTD
ncbi:MAG: PilZ domain-containing protein [Gammaproteobacteria bacterium]|nr:PilZ domain-containing protein [Gammaproteobacteria bacterium]